MKNKTIIILPLVLGTFMAALDNSIVNVSLPVMQKQFGVALDDLQWIITAYMLAFCVFMPLTNWAKNKIGLFYMYIISIIVFISGSLLCGLSGELYTLVAARVLQALGGGALTPCALAMLSVAFSKEERGKVMGYWGLGVVIGPALGPTLGGFLTQYYGWPSIFFINIPFGLLALFLSFRYLRNIDDRKSGQSSFDVSGFVLFTLFIVLFQLAISSISKAGFGFIFWIPMSVSLASLYLFIRVELGKSAPLLDLSVFKSSEFVNSILVTVIRSAALFGGVFLLPFLLQGVMGYTEVQTGLLLLPASAAIAALMPFAGNWSDKHGAKWISVVGLLLIAVSMLHFAWLKADSSVLAIGIPMVVRGIGLAFLFSPVSSAVINAVQANKSATASSYYSLFMQIGGSVGISILAVLHQFLLHQYLQAGKMAAQHHALKGGFLVSMLLVLIAVWPALKLSSKGTPRSAVEEA